MEAAMSREETPIWLKRRIKRHLARGRNHKASLVLVNSLSPREMADDKVTRPDNVLIFPGVMRLRMEDCEGT
jgi:hypothetical protein